MAKHIHIWRDRGTKTKYTVCCMVIRTMGKSNTRWSAKSVGRILNRRRRPHWEGDRVVRSDSKQTSQISVSQLKKTFISQREKFQWGCSWLAGILPDSWWGTHTPSILCLCQGPRFLSFSWKREDFGNVFTGQCGRSLASLILRTQSHVCSWLQGSWEMWSTMCTYCKKKMDFGKLIACRLPWWLRAEILWSQRLEDAGSTPDFRRVPGGGKWAATPIFSPEKSHEQKFGELKNPVNRESDRL